MGGGGGVEGRSVGLGRMCSTSFLFFSVVALQNLPNLLTSSTCFAYYCSHFSSHKLSSFMIMTDACFWHCVAVLAGN